MRRTDDRGSMTVVATAIVATAAALAVAAATASGLAVAAERAQGAADASALAAAHDARDRRARGAAYVGVDAPSCTLARDVASRWGAVVTRCAIEPGGVALVEVQIALGPFDVSRAADAGPRSGRRR